MNYLPYATLDTPGRSNSLMVHPKNPISPISFMISRSNDSLWYAYVTLGSNFSYAYDLAES